MRGVVLASLLVVLLVPSGIAGVHALVVVAPPVAVHGLIFAGAPSASHPAAAALNLVRPHFENQTLAPGLTAAPRPGAGGVPVSAIAESPPPEIPSTTPVVVSFLSNTRTCCYEGVFTPPAGPFETIVLNYTGRAVLGVFDSSYRAYVGGAEVLFGTTPEYGTWTVLQNLSTYSSLFQAPVNFTFLLGAAVTNGYFLTNVTISFYPVPTGGTPPPAPNEVLPIWSLQSVTSSSGRIFANVTVPTNTTAATLQLYLYGFGADEFWWAGTSPARVLEFGTNSTPLAAVMPFPYVNTGGGDLFLWKPITAVFTTNDRPYEINLTGALGAIEGTHQFWAGITGVAASSTWIIEGSLLLWTNASVLGASTTGASFTSVGPNRAGATVTESVAYSDASHLVTKSGAYDVVSSGNDSFTSTTTGGALWANLSALTSLAETTRTALTNGSIVDDRSYSFPYSLDQGGQASPSSGSYPYFANFTTYMLNVYQEWNAVRSVWWYPSTGPVLTYRDAVDDQLGGANGVYGGVEKVIGPNAAEITAINFVSSSTTKQYTEAIGAPANARVYSHLLVGQSYQPPLPDEAETVTTDQVRATPFPISVVPEFSPMATEIGTNVTVVAATTGGAGPYSFVWSGLPKGCSARNASVLVCAPTTPGVFGVGVLVTDGLGDGTGVVVAPLVVAPALAPVVFSNATAVDVGGTLNVSVAPGGGLPPFQCAWSVSGTVQGPTGPCAGGFAFAPATAGVQLLGVKVTDGVGATAWGANLSVLVGGALSVAVSTSAPAAIGAVGAPIVLGAAILGGVPPYSFVWMSDPSQILGRSGPNFTWTPSSAGNYSIVVTVRDAAGAQVVSPVTTLEVLPASASTVTPSNTSSGPDWPLLLAIGLVVGELGIIAVLLWLRRAGARRPPPRPPRSPARR